MEKEIVVRHIKDESKDTASLEIGTAKFGCIKVYGNPDEVENFKKKLDNMISLREYANTKLATETNEKKVFKE